MSNRRPYALLSFVFWVAAAGLAASAAAQEPHNFGEEFAMGPDSSITVARRDTADFRTRYASEFADAQNLAAFELRFGKDAIVHFKTDRSDPAQSDIVALCGTERVNILKIGSGRFDAPDEYTFGLPGFYQAKDGRWGSIATGGAMPMLLFFDLPAGCSPKSAKLLATIGVGDGDARSYQLLFSDSQPK